MCFVPPSFTVWLVFVAVIRSSGIFRGLSGMKRNPPPEDNTVESEPSLTDSQNEDTSQRLAHLQDEGTTQHFQLHKISQGLRNNSDEMAYWSCKVEWEDQQQNAGTALGPADLKTNTIAKVDEAAMTPHPLVVAVDSPARKVSDTTQVTLEAPQDFTAEEDIGTVQFSEDHLKLIFELQSDLSDQKFKQEVMEQKLDMVLDICTHLPNRHKHQERPQQPVIIPARPSSTSKSQVENEAKLAGLH